MGVFSVAVCAVCAVIFGSLVKRTNGEYALLIAVGAAVLILLAAVRQISPLLVQIESLAGSTVLEKAQLSVLVRAVGIAMTGQLAVHVCKDAGESALAYAVDLAAKAAILAASLPLLLQIFEYLEEIVRF